MRPHPSPLQRRGSKIGTLKKIELENEKDINNWSKQ